MDVNDYIREAKRQLNEPRNYKVLAKDPTKTNNNLYKIDSQKNDW